MDSSVIFSSIYFFWFTRVLEFMGNQKCGLFQLTFTPTVIYANVDVLKPMRNPRKHNLSTVDPGALLNCRQKLLY